MATIVMFFIYSFSHDGISRHFRGDNKSIVIENLNVDNYFVKGKINSIFLKFQKELLLSARMKLKLY